MLSKLSLVAWSRLLSGEDRKNAESGRKNQTWETKKVKKNRARVQVQM